MATALINVVGHNSAGKTTLSKKLADDLDLERINGDDFRLFIYDHFRYFGNEKLGKKSPKNDQLNLFLVQYRHAIASILLAGGRSVIIDGSGATKQIRRLYLQKVAEDFPQTKQIIIYAQIDEAELIDRLKNRDRSQDESVWLEYYHTIRRQEFEPPTADEADELLIYNQHNYEDLLHSLRQMLEA